MAIVLGRPGVDGLSETVGVLREWQLAQQLVADVTEPERGVRPAGKVYVDAPMGALVQDLLFEDGWNADEPWTPLRRDLMEQVLDPGVQIEVIGPEQAHVRTAVQRASFDTSTFTDERWHAMAAGLPYADARCLVAYDDQGNAVATVTVWSAGPGKPGLLEPMGVHREHRGHGYGKAITVAAAAALQELGSSSAIVCTPSFNVGAVATYKSARPARLRQQAGIPRLAGNARTARDLDLEPGQRRDAASGRRRLTCGRGCSPWQANT